MVCEICDLGKGIRGVLFSVPDIVNNFRVEEVLFSSVKLVWDQPVHPNGILTSKDFRLLWVPELDKWISDFRLYAILLGIQFDRVEEDVHFATEYDIVQNRRSDAIDEILVRLVRQYRNR